MGIILIVIFGYLISRVFVTSSNPYKANGNFIIFDTETNGLPINLKAPADNINNWTRIVSISWIKIDAKGKELTSKSYIVKPSNFHYNLDAVRVHQITEQHALEYGLDLEIVCNEFQQDLLDANYLVAHNIEFDYPTILCEFARVGINTDKLRTISKLCTMKSSVDFCKIQTSKGYKYPKLNELYDKLFHQPLPDQHNSKSDAEACLKCFKELYNLKQFKNQIQ